MDFMTIMNVIHIVSAVSWAGGAFMIAWFITPAAKATGNEGQVFIRGLVQGTQMSLYMNVSAWIAVLSGTYMSWIYSGGFDLDWIISGKGLAITIGGILAGIALTIGMVTNTPSAKKIAALGKEIEARGGPPTKEQIEEIQTLQGRITTGGNWIAILLVISLVSMALGRRLF